MGRMVNPVVLLMLLLRLTLKCHHSEPYMNHSLVLLTLQLQRKTFFRQFLWRKFVCFLPFVFKTPFKKTTYLHFIDFKLTWTFYVVKKAGVILLFTNTYLRRPSFSINSR